MYEENAKMAGASIGGGVPKESNLQQAQRNANAATEALADSIGLLRNRLDPVLRQEPATAENGRAAAVPVDDPASATTYAFRELVNRTDYLRAQVDDLLRRLDL